MTKLLRSLFIATALSLLGILFATLPQTTHAQTPYAGFLATYYNGRALQGSPILSRLEPVVNWSYDTNGSPAPGVVPPTNFSTRWEGWYMMEHPGAWMFTYTSDDGHRHVVRSRTANARQD